MVGSKALYVVLIIAPEEHGSFNCRAMFLGCFYIKNYLVAFNLLGGLVLVFRSESFFKLRKYRSEYATLILSGEDFKTFIAVDAT